MRRTQRLRACVGSLLLLCSLTLLHAQNENRALPTNAESTRYVSQATIFAQQVETLNPNSVHDLYKIFFVLRCKDVPEAQRKALALRILTGEYPSDPEFKDGGSRTTVWLLHCRAGCFVTYAHRRRLASAVPRREPAQVGATHAACCRRGAAC